MTQESSCESFRRVSNYGMGTTDLVERTYGLPYSQNSLFVLVPDPQMLNARLQYSNKI
jgi:hypothetical protein